MAIRKSKPNRYRQYRRRLRLKSKVRLEKAVKKYRDLSRRLRSLLHPLKPYILTLIAAFMLFMTLAASCEYRNPLEKARLNRIAYPYIAATHLKLAQQYYDFGYVKEAQNELQNIVSSPFLSWQLKTIGSWQTKYESIRQTVFAQEETEKEIAAWEKWLADNPPSVKIYLRLSLLNYRIKNDSKARVWLEKAAYLDPVNEEVKKAKDLINSAN